MSPTRQITAAILLFAWFAPPTVAATLLVANKTDNTVDLIDPATGESTATLPTGEGPHEVSVSPGGGFAVISNYGRREKPGSSLTVVDLNEHGVVRRIELGRHSRPHGLAWIDENRLVVTAEGSRHLLVVEPESGEIVGEIETAQEISHMVAVPPDGSRAFVANIGSGSVTVVDLEKMEKIRDVPTGEGAEGIAVTPDGSEVWVGNRGADTLTILDSATLEVRAELPCPGFPIRVTITPDGKRVLVSCARTGEIALFDVAERKELRRSKLDLGTVPDAVSRLFGDRFGKSPVPVGLVVAPDGKRAWVAATQSDAVVVFDPSTLEILDLIRAGREPDGMALRP